MVQQKGCRASNYDDENKFMEPSPFVKPAVAQPLKKFGAKKNSVAFSPQANYTD
jgi:hypothetical protein